MNKANEVRNFLEVVVCVAISIIIIPLLNLIVNSFMLKAALKYDRLIYQKLLNSEYEKTMEIPVGEILARLENTTCKCQKDQS